MEITVSGGWTSSATAGGHVEGTYGGTFTFGWYGGLSFSVSGGFFAEAGVGVGLVGTSTGPFVELGTGGLGAASGYSTFGSASAGLLGTLGIGASGNPSGKAVRVGVGVGDESPTPINPLNFAGGESCRIYVTSFSFGPASQPGTCAAPIMPTYTPPDLVAAQERAIAQLGARLNPRIDPFVAGLTYLEHLNSDAAYDNSPKPNGPWTVGGVPPTTGNESGNGSGEGIPAYLTGNHPSSSDGGAGSSDGSGSNGSGGLPYGGVGGSGYGNTDNNASTGSSNGGSGGLYGNNYGTGYAGSGGGSGSGNDTSGTGGGTGGTGSGGYSGIPYSPPDSGTGTSNNGTGNGAAGVGASGYG